MMHDINYHNYIISKDILDADVVVSIPKLKTHEKVGITVAMKGLVGIVSNKECLAHYRCGDPEEDGDEYSNKDYLLKIAQIISALTYKSRKVSLTKELLKIIDYNYRRFLRIILKKILGGAWHGNDTAWRMVVDLVNIVKYYDSKGELKESPKRKNIVFVDGIIAGEGNGPLKPIPAPAKTIIFSDDLLFADMISCKLMGWDYKKIPLISRNDIEEILADYDRIRVILNGKSEKLKNIAPSLGRPFIPPDGWRRWILS